MLALVIEVCCWEILPSHINLWEMFDIQLKKLHVLIQHQITESCRQRLRGCVTKWTFPRRSWRRRCTNWTRTSQRWWRCPAGQSHSGRYGKPLGLSVRLPTQHFKIPYLLFAWVLCSRLELTFRQRPDTALVCRLFMPPAWKVRGGHLVIGSSVHLSVCLSVCNSVPLTNKVQYLKFGWW